MAENQLYGTFLVTDPGRTMSGLETSEEAGWKVAYRDDPSQRHWADTDGSSVTISTRSPALEKLHLYSEHQLPCQELLIKAHDEATAENICSIVLGGILLAYPDAFELPEDASVYSIDEFTQEILTSPGLSNRFSLQRDLALGVEA